MKSSERIYDYETAQEKAVRAELALAAAPHRDCWQPEDVMVQAVAYCGSILSMASESVGHLLDKELLDRVTDAQKSLGRLEYDLAHQDLDATKEKNP